MRPFKPAPKNASANRIRERYLHQLGLQRGCAPLTAAPHHPSSTNNNHVVVISGLPSLPEDRVTTMTEGQHHVMESHDFSITSVRGGHSQHNESVDANSLGDNEDMMESDDCGSSAHGFTMPTFNATCDAHSPCSKSTLSVSPNNVAGVVASNDNNKNNNNSNNTASNRESSDTAAVEHLTSMALAYPTALRKVQRTTPCAVPTPPPVNNNTLPFSLWRPNASLSKSASVLLDSSAYNDVDSVSSAGTSTTAESSLTATAAMVSRDWGAMPHNLGESPASAPGVHFQCGHPRLLGGNSGVIASVTNAQCGASGASSLAHALHRFNIDSDCEASSVASNSIVEDHNLMIDYEDDVLSVDDVSVASHASHASHASVGSVPKSIRASQQGNCRKKIGKTQRLMDRAAAHERILQIRSDRSRNMRASVVHSQRMGSSAAVAALSSCVMATTQGASDAQQMPQLSESPCSTSSSSAASLPLLHVQHGDKSTVGNDRSIPNTCDLGRTPTASNCNSDLRKLKMMAGSPRLYLHTLPRGVHILSAPNGRHPVRRGGGVAAPLMYHPRLVSRAPPPPPKVAAGTLPSVLGAESDVISSKPQTTVEVEVVTESRESEDTSCLQHTNHQATIDDVMEVAMTLSKLGERTCNPVPRIR
mmetsp:Transcript_15407/g.27872  ORF Transcript_15407/g.27872 Transcript_15407/m.27872 type:complete len:647 (+) Transcript_15407:499-2439(+)